MFTSYWGQRIVIGSVNPCGDKMIISVSSLLNKWLCVKNFRKIHSRYTGWIIKAVVEKYLAYIISIKNHYNNGKILHYHYNIDWLKVRALCRTESSFIKLPPIHSPYPLPLLLWSQPKTISLSGEIHCAIIIFGTDAKMWKQHHPVVGSWGGTGNNHFRLEAQRYVSVITSILKHEKAESQSISWWISVKPSQSN